MSPISAVFMIVAVSPYIGMKFGLTPILILAPMLVLFGFKSYQFYCPTHASQNYALSVQGFSFYKCVKS